jgi:hypothetical protein
MLTFEGRAIPDEMPAEYEEEDYDFAPTPCVFCGAPVTHVNDGGNACVAGAVVAGEVHHFAYCNEGGCRGERDGTGGTRTEEDEEQLWTCGECEVDCLSGECHECRKARHLVDRDITDPFEDEDETASRWVLVSSEGRIAVPACASLRGAFHYAGTLGESTRTVIRFASDGAAAAFCRLCPHETTRYAKSSDAQDFADDEINTLFLRAGGVS